MACDDMLTMSRSFKRDREFVSIALENDQLQLKLIQLTRILRDILLLEAIFEHVNHHLPLPKQEQYLPGLEKELNSNEAKTDESFVDELPDLKDEKEATLLRFHPTASHRLETLRYKGVNPRICTHKILSRIGLRTICAKSEKGKPKNPQRYQGRTLKTLDAWIDLPSSSDSPLGKPGTTVYLKGGITASQMFEITNSYSIGHGDAKEPFYVKECIVLGHKISKVGLEVDRAKVEVIPSSHIRLNVKGSDSLGTPVFTHDSFRTSQKCPLNEAQTHYTTTEKELLAVVYAFEKFRSYLVMSKSIVYTDHSAIKYLFAKKDAKENSCG
ncbi:reverse transcriptase domain-containing protein [Tanacetum coccineum]